jgi:cell pole-organizing protein PopZ
LNDQSNGGYVKLRILHAFSDADTFPDLGHEINLLAALLIEGDKHRAASDPSGTITVSLLTLQRRLRVDRTTIMRWRDILVVKGYLHVQGSEFDGSAARYSLDERVWSAYPSHGATGADGPSHGATGADDPSHGATPTRRTTRPHPSHGATPTRRTTRPHPSHSAPLSPYPSIPSPSIPARARNIDTFQDHEIQSGDQTEGIDSNNMEPHSGTRGEGIIRQWHAVAAPDSAPAWKHAALYAELAGRASVLPPDKLSAASTNILEMIRNERESRGKLFGLADVQIQIREILSGAEQAPAARPAAPTAPEPEQELADPETFDPRAELGHLFQFGHASVPEGGFTQLVRRRVLDRLAEQADAPPPEPPPELAELQSLTRPELLHRIDIGTLDDLGELAQTLPLEELVKWARSNPRPQEETT